jgi:4-amino-4-deoxy-L-arabinose transferase-like glycosyltransferase
MGHGRSPVEERREIVRCNLIALICCVFLIAAASLWINDSGIQTDEALFSAGLYPPFQHGYWMWVRGNRLPLMVMTYVGALKSWLYAPLLAIWSPSPIVVRLPAILLSAVTVLLFYRLLLRISTRRVAVVGCILLATDPLYVLFSMWDWGPVVIQHFCLIAGVLLLVRWHQEQRWWMLALGFFVFGLGLWDKALFAWSLVGLAVAAIIVFPRIVIGALQTRALPIAIAAFALGSLPLIIFNIRHKLVTFRENTHWAWQGFAGKANLLRLTVEGDAIMYAFLRPPFDLPLREPQTAVERAFVKFSDLFGNRRRSFMGYALVASVAAAFLFMRQLWKPVTFSLLFVGVTWAQMLPLANGGTSPHHTILLWPFPVLIVAVVLGQLKRPWLVSLLPILVAGNLIVFAAHSRDLIRNGPSASFSDAIYAASDKIASLAPKQLFVIDWGFWDTLRLFHKGQVPLFVADDPVTDEGRNYARTQFSDPCNVFIGHTKENEFSPGQSARYVEFAAREGYEQKMIGVYADRNGRSVIELFRFEKQP